MATSAFQVEGNPQEVEVRSSDWAEWTGRSGAIEDSSTADRACEFFLRYPGDIDLCRKLNLNAFRLSLNWPALAPTESSAGELDRDGVRYYRRLLESIKAQGMSTFVTLFHFCLPVWLASCGGWNSQRTVDAFESYAACAAREFGDLVDYWLTINEPLVYAYQGYVPGRWPPGYKKNYLWAFQAIRRMLEGHARAYAAIHRHCPAASVSYALHWRPFVPRNPLNPLDQLSRYFRDQIFNHLFPQAVSSGELQFPFPMSMEPPIRAMSGPVPGLRHSLDYLAVNYYTREICQFQPGWPPDVFGSQADEVRLKTTDMGWEIFPEGLYYLLTEDVAPYRLDRDGKALPIIITENGMASMFSHDLDEGDWSLEDDHRVSFIVEHLKSVHQAINQGANVRGYLYWSLLDNFEWAEGLKPRFGLVRVAYPTQERTLRKSARIYSEIARQNALPASLPV